MQLEEESRVDVHKLDLANAIERTVSHELRWAMQVDPNQLRSINDRVLIVLEKKPLSDHAMQRKFPDIREAIPGILKKEMEFGTVSTRRVSRTDLYFLTDKGKHLVEFKRTALF